MLTEASSAILILKLRKKILISNSVNKSLGKIFEKGFLMSDKNIFNKMLQFSNVIKYQK